MELHAVFVHLTQSSFARYFLHSKLLLLLLAVLLHALCVGTHKKLTDLMGR